MIRVKQAPAGYIAQFFTDEKLPYKGLLIQSYKDHHFMDVTGEWCQTSEEAIESVKKARLKEVKKLQKKLSGLEAKVAELRSWIKFLEETSEKVDEPE